MKLKAIKPFRDKETNEVYQVNAEVVTNDIERVNNLVSRGLAVIVSLDAPEAQQPKETPEKTVNINGEEVALSKAKEAFGKAGIQVAKNAGVDGLTKKLSELTEEQLTALLEALAPADDNTLSNGHIYNI